MFLTTDILLGPRAPLALLWFAGANYRKLTKAECKRIDIMITSERLRQITDEFCNGEHSIQFLSTILRLLGAAYSFQVTIMTDDVVRHSRALSASRADLENTDAATGLVPFFRDSPHVREKGSSSSDSDSDDDYSGPPAKLPRRFLPQPHRRRRQDRPSTSSDSPSHSDVPLAIRLLMLESSPDGVPPTSLSTEEPTRAIQDDVSVLPAYGSVILPGQPSQGDPEPPVGPPGQESVSDHDKRSVHSPIGGQPILPTATDQSGDKAIPPPLGDTTMEPPVSGDKAIPPPLGDTTMEPPVSGDKAIPPPLGDKTMEPPVSGDKAIPPPLGDKTMEPPVSGDEANPPHLGDETMEPPTIGDQAHAPVHDMPTPIRPMRPRRRSTPIVVENESETSDDSSSESEDSSDLGIPPPRARYHTSQTRITMRRPTEAQTRRQFLRHFEDRNQSPLPNLEQILNEPVIPLQYDIYQPSSRLNPEEAFGRPEPRMENVSEESEQPTRGSDDSSFSVSEPRADKSSPDIQQSVGSPRHLSRGPRATHLPGPQMLQTLPEEDEVDQSMDTAHTLLGQPPDTVVTSTPLLPPQDVTQILPPLHDDIPSNQPIDRQFNEIDRQMMGIHGQTLSPVEEIDQQMMDIHEETFPPREEIDKQIDHTEPTDEELDPEVAAEIPAVLALVLNLSAAMGNVLYFTDLCPHMKCTKKRAAIVLMCLTGLAQQGKLFLQQEGDMWGPIKILLE